MESDAPLEIPVDPDPRRARIPPVAVDVLERVAMAGALHETAWLVRHWIVRRVRKWAERIVSRGDARRIDVVFGARRAVLEIIAPAVLGHPRSFNERMNRRVTVVLAEPLPAVIRRIQAE